MIKSSYLFKLFYIIVGIIFGCICFFVSPLKAVALIAIAAGICITLYNLTVGLCIFILGMSLIPHEMWNNVYGVAAVAFFVIVYIAKAATKKECGVLLKNLDFFFILFAITVVLSTMTSITPLSSIKTMIFYITALLLVVVIIGSVSSKKSLDWIMITLFISVIVTSMYGIYQRIQGVAVNPSWTDVYTNKGMPGRIYSTMGNPNNYAEYLIIMLPFCAAYIFNLKSKFKKVLFTLALVFPMAALALTYSRSSWVGFAVAIFIIIAFKNWRLIPIALVLGIVSIPFLPYSIKHRFMTIGNMKDSSIMYRVYIWDGALKILKRYWFTGIGAGPKPFSIIYSNFAHPKAQVAAHSHMVLLEVWIEMGIASFVSLIWYSLRMFKKSIIGIKKSSDMYIKNILIASIASIAGISVTGLVEYVWFYPRIMLIFWMAFGIMTACIKLLRKEVEI